jgi:hypothetical protein
VPDVALLDEPVPEVESVPEVVPVPDDEPVPDVAEPVPLVDPGVVFAEPEMVVEELPGVVDDVVLDGAVVLELLLVPPGVVVLLDGAPVPLVDVLLLVLPPGVVVLLPPGAVVAEVLLESRVVVVTSSRRVQAVSEASAISVMAPA